MWWLQPTSRGTSRVLISLTCEMGTAMPVSKDPGGDATALWAMKNLRKLYIPCPHTCTDDSMLLFPEGLRDGEGGWQGGELTLQVAGWKCPRVQLGLLGCLERV